LFDGGVVGAKGKKGRILAVCSPFETGDTENPLLLAEKGQKGGCAKSAILFFPLITIYNQNITLCPYNSLLLSKRGGSQNFLAFGTNFCPVAAWCS
jgi:hypothetical protein